MDDSELSAGAGYMGVNGSDGTSQTHVVVVSGLSPQDVQSGVAVVKKVLHYLSTQASSGGYKAATTLLIEHVLWVGDYKDQTIYRLNALKDVGITSGAGVVLIKKFNVNKNTKNTSALVTVPANVPLVPLTTAPPAFGNLKSFGIGRNS